MLSASMQHTINRFDFSEPRIAILTALLCGGETVCTVAHHQAGLDL
jgi:hypothetical protein